MSRAVEDELATMVMRTRDERDRLLKLLREWRATHQQCRAGHVCGLCAKTAAVVKPEDER